MSVTPKEGVLVETKTFVWKLKLSKLLGMADEGRLFSPHFIQDECEWHLKIFQIQKWIGIILFLDTFKNKKLVKGDTGIPATFRIMVEIVGPESKNLKEERTLSWEFLDVGHGWPDIFFTDPKTVGKDDVLEVNCHIRLNEDRRSWINPESQNSSIVPDIEKMLDDSILTDLTIQVDGEQLKAHKFILAARSPVFRRMFESEMVEAANSQLIIGDFSAKVVQQMLEFMYSGDANLIGKNGVPLTELLQIGDKYAIVQLKGVCEAILSNSLTVENVIEMLIFADMHNAPTLKKQTLDFIVKNSVQIVKTKAYFEISSVKIFREICTAMALKNIKPDA